MSEDSISDISDKVSFNDNKEVEKNIFSKKVNMNKKITKNNTQRSKSVILDDRSKKREIMKYRYNIDEEQKNNINKKANILIKSGNFTKIFLKNKDFLLRSIN